MRNHFYGKAMLVFCAAAGCLTGFGINAAFGAGDRISEYDTKDNTLLRGEYDSVFFNGDKPDGITSAPALTGSGGTMEQNRMPGQEVSVLPETRTPAPEPTRAAALGLTQAAASEPTRTAKPTVTPAQEALVPVQPSVVPTPPTAPSETLAPKETMVPEGTMAAEATAVPLQTSIPGVAPMPAATQAPSAGTAVPSTATQAPQTVTTAPSAVTVTPSMPAEAPSENEEAFTYPAKIFGQTPIVNRSDETVTYFEFAMDLIETLEAEIKREGLNEMTLFTKFMFKALLCGIDVKSVKLNEPIPRDVAALAMHLAAQVLDKPGTGTGAKSAEKYASDVSGCSSAEKKAIAYLYGQGIAEGAQGKNFYPDNPLSEAEGTHWIARAAQCWQ